MWAKSSGCLAMPAIGTPSRPSGLNGGHVSQQLPPNRLRSGRQTTALFVGQAQSFPPNCSRRTRFSSFRYLITSCCCWLIQPSNAMRSSRNGSNDLVIAASITMRAPPGELLRLPVCPSYPELIGFWTSSNSWTLREERGRTPITNLYRSRRITLCSGRSRLFRVVRRSGLVVAFVRRMASITTNNFCDTAPRPILAGTWHTVIPASCLF